MTEVITIGEPMIVLIAEQIGTLKNVTSFSKSVAGAELNTSVGLTRLGHPTTYITRLGIDPFGECILDFIESENINKENIIIDKEHPTGSYLKSKPINGEDPSVYYYRKNSAASFLSPQDIEKIDFSGAKLLHISGITAALSPSCKKAVDKAIDKAKKQNMLISFDPNIRKSLWYSPEEMRVTLNNLASKSDIVIPGIKEGIELTNKETPREIADFYLESGAKTVIVKLGAPGAYYKTRKEAAVIEGFHVENVVDTVGAGDGFAAGVLSALLEGLSLKEAVKRGNAIGAMVITSKEDNSALPTKQQLDDFLKLY